MHVSSTRQITVIVKRPEQSKTFRIERLGFGAAPVWHYGDRNFNPSPITVLANDISVHFPNVKGLIVLDSLDMTIYRAKSQSSNPGSMPGIGLGGARLGEAIFGKACAPMGDEDVMTVSCEVEIGSVPPVHCHRPVSAVEVLFLLCGLRVSFLPAIRRQRFAPMASW